MQLVLLCFWTGVFVVNEGNLETAGELLQQELCVLILVLLEEGIHLHGHCTGENFTQIPSELRVCVLSVAHLVMTFEGREVQHHAIHGAP